LCSDVLPRLLVGALKEAAAVLGEDVEPVEVEGVLADGWALADRGAALLHEAEQLVQPGAALRVVVNLIQALQILHFSLLRITSLRCGSSA